MAASFGKGNGQLGMSQSTGLQDTWTLLKMLGAFYYPFRGAICEWHIPYPESLIPTLQKLNNNDAF